MNEMERLVSVAVRRALEIDIRNLDPAVVHRLGQARQTALARQRQAAAGLSLIDRLGTLGMEPAFQHARTAAAIAVLMLGMIGTYYWNMFEDADEYAEIDSAILADDLPVDAYSDSGFHAWLDSSSQSSP